MAYLVDTPGVPNYGVTMDDVANEATDGLGISQEIGPWQVHMEWPRATDQGGPRWITVRPRPDASEDELAGGISSTILRQVDFTAAGTAWRQAAARLDPDRAELIDLANRSIVLSQALRAEFERNGMSDEYMALLAVAYGEVVSAGERSVNANLAALVGRRPETVRGHVKAARARGFLSSVKARAGGHASDEAREIASRHLKEKG